MRVELVIQLTVNSQREILSDLQDSQEFQATDFAN